MLYADFHGHDLLDLVSTDFFCVRNIKTFDVDTALHQFPFENVSHLLEFKVIVGEHRQRVLSLFYAGIRTLKIKPRRNFLIGLLDGVFDFLLVYFRNDVEGWHGWASLEFNC